MRKYIVKVQICIILGRKDDKELSQDNEKNIIGARDPLGVQYKRTKEKHFKFDYYDQRESYKN